MKAFEAELVKRLRGLAAHANPPLMADERLAINEAADFIASHTEGAGAEPVAWLIEDTTGKYPPECEPFRPGTEPITSADVAAGFKATPLYASPTLPGDVVVVPRAYIIPRPENLPQKAELGWDLAQQELLKALREDRRAMIAVAPIPTPEGKVADADGWQDISTAPKDGTMFWALEVHPNKTFRAVSYEAKYETPSQLSGLLSREVSQRCHNLSANRWAKPTHWRPLPVPPSSERE